MQQKPKNITTGSKRHDLQIQQKMTTEKVVQSKKKYKRKKEKIDYEAINR